MSSHRAMCLLVVGVIAFGVGCRAAQSPYSGTRGPTYSAGTPSSASEVDVAPHVSGAAATASDSSVGGAGGELELPILDDGRWHVMVTPFVWASSIDGTVGEGALQGPVEEDFSDIFDDIQGSAQLHLAATRGDWAILSEFAYYDMSVSEPLGPLGLVTLDYDEEKLDFELALAYRVLDAYLWAAENGGRAGRGELALMGGGRYTSLDQDFKFTGALGRSVKTSSSEDWIDPFVGARWALGLTESLELDLRGDVGGFGVGSDLTWTAQGALAWWIARRATLRLGYRHRSIDYESGDFVYDVDLFGPFCSFTWTF